MAVPLTLRLPQSSTQPLALCQPCHFSISPSSLPHFGLACFLLQHVRKELLKVKAASLRLPLAFLLLFLYWEVPPSHPAQRPSCVAESEIQTIKPN